MRAFCVNSRYNLATQRGAVLPIAIFFFAILCLGLFSVYNMAQVTSEKRHLTNAADAIAYSDATIAAEALNYTAYTNRAMVSNYVAISQLTGMWSTTTMADQYWRNMPKALKAIGALAEFIPEVGPIVKSVVGGFATVGDAIQKMSNLVRITSFVLANTGSAVSTLSNYSIFTAQQVHLASSITAISLVQQDLLKANAPTAEYIPTMIEYQSVKSIADLFNMLKFHRPPGKFLGLEKMQDKMPRDPNGAIGPLVEFNLVHRLMTGEMFNSTSGGAGRRLFPKEVGLWTINMCHQNAVSEGIGALANGTGLEDMIPGMPDAKIAGPIVQGVLGVLGSIASPLMCLYTRTGGTRAIQLDDGSYAWSNIDVIDIDLDLLVIHPKMALAGSSNMSRLSKNRSAGNQDVPPDLAQFVNEVKRNEVAKNSYWGEAVGLDDCVYETLPSGELYAPRIGGACASLAPGVAKGNGTGNGGGYFNRGIFKLASGPGDSAIRRTPSVANQDENLADRVIAPIESALTSAGNSINSAQVSGELLNAQENIGTRNPTAFIAYPSGLPASGSSLGTPIAGTEEDRASIVAALSQQAANSLNISNVSAGNLSSQIGSVLQNVESLAADSNEPVEGSNPLPGFVKVILRALGLGDTIDALTMRSSRGTQTLWQKKGVGVDMGLPAARFGLWEMKDANIGNYQVDRTDPGNLFIAPKKIQDNALKDMGPSFVVGLQEPADNVPLKAENKFNLGRSPIKDYDADRHSNYLRTIGKARVYYRSPLERWTTRQQAVTHANLMQPYWNARLEGLSYPEKLLFSTLIN